MKSETTQARRANSSTIGLPIVVALLLVAGLSALNATEAAQRGRMILNRRAGRPPGQVTVPSGTSTSEMTRAATWPAGCGKCTVEFDYFVDSEPHYDKLNIYVDGVLNAPPISGRNLSGHRSITVSPGPHTVTFEYFKDGSVDVGLDTAWVDNVEFQSDIGGTIEYHAFDDWSTLGVVPPNWTASGSGAWGGWVLARDGARRSVGRPQTQARVSSSTSYMQRTILFPSATNNFIAYNYYTDSDPGDSLSVYIDGVLMQQVSGLNRGGTNRIALAMGGPHIVRFEYAKNSSTDAGLDTARLDNVVCFSGTSVFEVHDFTGQTPGATPIGWNTGGTGTGWMPVGFRVTESTPHVTIVDKSTPTTEPSIDGVIRDKEYFRNGMRATRILLPDYANASGDHAVLYLGASTVTNALVIGLNARSATPLALGDEKSTVVLYFDANRAGSLDALGCPGNPTLPGPEDRQIVINLQAAAGVGTQVSSITQSKGACATGSFAWAAASAAEDWPATVTATETWGASKKDRGAVHTEIRIVLPTAVLNEGKLGFGLTHANTQGSLSFERFPYHDVEGAGPIEDNVYSWETLILGYTPGYVEQSENTFDHCCWPFGTSPGK